MLSITLDSAASAVSDTIEGQEDEGEDGAAAGISRTPEVMQSKAKEGEESNEKDTASASAAMPNSFNVSELVVQMADLDSAQNSLELQGESAKPLDAHPSE